MPNKNKVTWIKRELFNGVQTVWSVEGGAGYVIHITRDNRPNYKDPSYPYAVEVLGNSYGSYNKLAIAKKDALIHLANATANNHHQ